MVDRNWFSSAFIVVLIPCAIFRFVVFAPFGYYWALASTHWDVIKDHVELHNGTYPSIIATGEKIASKWGTFGFYWNFAVWIPTFWFPPPLNLPFTVIDTVITIYLARASHYQTAYAPHSKGSCTSAAHDWYRPPGANESFFEAAARLNSTVATPTKMCRTFVEEWQYGIVLSAFYATISLLNIIAFLGAIFGARRDGESLLTFVTNLLKVVLEQALNVPKGIALLVVGFLWSLPQCMFRCLPLSIKSPVRFGRRYAVKSVLGAEQKAELGIMEMKTVYEQKKRQHMPCYQGGGGEPSPLSNFLSIYDMLMVVTEELHYTDIMNLSRVSKSVREAVLPAGDLGRRVQAFRRYTCHGAQRTLCWLCDKQICNVSSWDL
ncbi:hypothetical protein FB567DRAFT_604714 [Paraphoma chrysanthemicola]|uniref:F-box domain-containing protein n=1 Tax=Paraphoma chrysanthemicola TaxID=798071 RepID=A0A8K0R1J3_9PLEO|nr:hypothetical protein FB567DRAFT_604714 [Paraphoma chrysanthemicola]